MTRTNEQIAEDYTKFRGRCQELSSKACEEDPSLTLVRGHYYCLIWGTREPHWWTVRGDGSIHDPTKAQFPSNGSGVYEPFDGIIPCSNCGKDVLEEDASFDSNYAFCSDLCHGRFIGIY